MTRPTALLGMLLLVAALLGTAHAAAPDAACADACATAGMHDAAPPSCADDDACDGQANHCLAHCLTVLHVAVEPPCLARAVGIAFRAPDDPVDDAPPGRLLRPPIPA